MDGSTNSWKCYPCSEPLAAPIPNFSLQPNQFQLFSLSTGTRLSNPSRTIPKLFEDQKSFFLTNAVNSSKLYTHSCLQADGLASYQPQAEQAKPWAGML